MLIKNTLNLNKEMNMQSNSLLNTPINGTVEYNTLGLYFTHNSLRKKIGYSTDPSTNTIFYQGLKSNNIGESSIGAKGYTNLYPPVGYTMNDTWIGSLINDYTIQLNNNPGYAVDAFKDLHRKITGTSFAQVLKVKSNTADTITFYEPILVTGNPLYFSNSSVSYTADQTTWQFDENYIDTGLTSGSFVDCLFDGIYMWLLSDQTTLHRVNVFTKEYKIITHGIANGLAKSLLYNGKHIHILAHGVNGVSVNTETFNLMPIITNNSLQNAKQILIGSTILFFGTNPNNSDENSWTIKNATVTNMQSLTASGMTYQYRVKNLVYMPNIPNIVYVIAENIFNGGGVTIWEFDITTNSFSLNLSPITIDDNLNYHSVMCDGNYIYVSVTGPSYFLLYKYNPVTKEPPILLKDFGYGTSTRNIGNMIFSGSMFHVLINPTTVSSQDGSNNFFSLMANTPHYSNGYSQSNVIVSRMSSSSKNLLCSDELIFMWGGRYLIKDFLPYTKKKLIAHSDKTSYFEKGIAHKWKTINLNYIVELDDYGLLVDTSSAKTITLLSPIDIKGQEFIIKDDTGNAATNNITISGSIEGAGSATISTNYGTLKLVSNGTSYRII